MYFFLEWFIAANRAAWFPLIWALGLEAKAVEPPPGLLPEIDAAEALAGPRLRVIAPRSRRAASW